MEYTAKQIADFLGGIIVGNPDSKISTISKIQEAETGSLCFLANLAYENFLYSTKASAVLINNDFVPKKEVETTLIKVEDAYKAFAQIVDWVHKLKNAPKKGIEEFAFVSESAKIGNEVFIGSFSYISKNAVIENNVVIHPQVYIGEDVVIGEGSILYPGVKIYNDCKVGKNCIVHAGVVIGSDGFGFAPQSDGSYKKIQQLGNVIVEDDVEIGANTAIDRATMGSTIIKKGVKLDNLIQIAHNVEIGQNTVMAALSGVAGSAKVGQNCMVGGQVGIVGHISVADKTNIGAQAGIIQTIEKENTTVLGSPAVNIRDFYRSYSIFKILPELQNQIKDLQKQINELKK